jgi:PAS domain S-box-containing protein
MKTPLHILLVEDSEDDAVLILHHIRKGGWDIESDRVETADGLRTALREKPWDIILADYVMPHFTGLGALAILQESRLDIPLIVISGTIGEDVAVEAMKAGAQDYIMKDNLHRLLPAIERELGELKSRAERNRIKTALQRSETRYHSVVTAMADGVCLLAANGEILAVNPAAERIEGRSAEQMVGHPPEHPPGRAVCEDGRPFPAELHPALVTLRTGEPQADVIMGLRRPDDSLVWLSVNSQPLMAEGESRPYAVVTTFHDITGRKQAEKELARLNRALRVLSDANQALVRITDETALLHEICRIAVEVGGYALAWVGFAEHDEAQTLRPVAHAGLESGYIESAHVSWGDNERGRGPGGIAIRTGKPSLMRNIPFDPAFAPWREAAIRHGYQSIIAVPLVAEGRTVGALGVYSVDVDAFDPTEVDILTELAGNLAFGLSALRTRAERTHAEEKRELLLQELRSRNEELQSIVVMASHDLRIPLVNICGFAGEMERTLQDVEALLADKSWNDATRTQLTRLLQSDMADSMRRIRHGSQKMDELLNGLRRLSHIGTAEVHPVTINMELLVAEVLETVRGGSREADVDIATEGTLPSCRGDVMLISQVFSNLIDNAIKYRHPDRPCRIRIRGRQEGDANTYQVQDDGIGIAPDHMDKVFEMFYQLDPSFEGQGLGLTIVRWILNRQDGRIRMESEAGSGTTFSVTLPRA